MSRFPPNMKLIWSHGWRDGRVRENSTRINDCEQISGKKDANNLSIFTSVERRYPRSAHHTYLIWRSTDSRDMPNQWENVHAYLCRSVEQLRIWLLLCSSLKERRRREGMGERERREGVRRRWGGSALMQEQVSWQLDKNKQNNLHVFFSISKIFHSIFTKKNLIIVSQRPSWGPCFNIPTHNCST